MSHEIIYVVVVKLNNTDKILSETCYSNEETACDEVKSFLEKHHLADMFRIENNKKLFGNSPVPAELINNDLYSLASMIHLFGPLTAYVKPLKIQDYAELNAKIIHEHEEYKSSLVQVKLDPVCGYCGEEYIPDNSDGKQTRCANCGGC